MIGQHDFYLDTDSEVSTFNKLRLVIRVIYDLEVSTEPGSSVGSLDAIIRKVIPTEVSVIVGGNIFESDQWKDVVSDLRVWILKETEKLESFQDYGVTEQDAKDELTDIDDARDTEESLSAGRI